MPILSHLHQLFDVHSCYAYMHQLRWKERPLQCPRCQSAAVDPWGNYHYRPGCKRYWCNGCERTFNDLTNTMMHQSKRSLPYWILATFLFVGVDNLSASLSNRSGVWHTHSTTQLLGRGVRFLSHRHILRWSCYDALCHP